MTTRHVLMVRPNGFGFNPETAASNAFAQPGEATTVQEEFDNLVKVLEDAGTTVTILDGPPEAPDAVFPNNWFSTHEAQEVILYPMANESRRRERQPLLWRTTLDLTDWENKTWFLEGTGSLVLDRDNRIAYAALSPRTNAAAAEQWGKLMNYEVITFETNANVYHTNVLMAVGENFAVLCEEIIDEPSKVKQALNGKEIISITANQMASFCGNVLELATGIVVSEQAWNAFTPIQQNQLKDHGKPLIADVQTIESLGGGSVRCMIAEIFGYPL